MKTKWIAATAGVAMLAATALLLARGTSRAAALPAGGQIVLVADLAEADAPCGCGRIIRAVRDASKRGVATREVDAEKSPQLVAEYHASPPSVIVLDATGREVRRFEGEDEATVTALTETLGGAR